MSYTVTAKQLGEASKGQNGRENAYAEERHTDAPGLRAKYYRGRRYKGTTGHADRTGQRSRSRPESDNKLQRAATPPPEHRTLTLCAGTGKARFR